MINSNAVNTGNPIKTAPEWGCLTQINLVRHYDLVRRGLEPVKYILDWKSSSGECGSRFEECVVECPECFNAQTLLYDTQGDHDFVDDSNFCASCETEFIINPKSEFEVLVKQVEE